MVLRHSWYSVVSRPKGKYITLNQIILSVSYQAQTMISSSVWYKLKLTHFPTSITWLQRWLSDITCDLVRLLGSEPLPNIPQIMSPHKDWPLYVIWTEKYESWKYMNISWKKICAETEIGLLSIVRQALNEMKMW